MTVPAFRSFRRPSRRHFGGAWPRLFGDRQDVGFFVRRVTSEPRDDGLRRYQIAECIRLDFCPPCVFIYIHIYPHTRAQHPLTHVHTYTRRAKALQRYTTRVRAASPIRVTRLPARQRPAGSHFPRRPAPAARWVTQLRSEFLVNHLTGPKFCGGRARPEERRVGFRCFRPDLAHCGTLGILTVFFFLQYK